MAHVRLRPRVACALVAATLTTLTVAAAGPAGAEEQVTLDVLKIVDGEYTVETVTVPARQRGREGRPARGSARRRGREPVRHLRGGGHPRPLLGRRRPGPGQRRPHRLEPHAGAGQTVAVLDTGVDGTHPDLAGAMVPGTDTVGGAGSPWHGTGVAGIIAARADNGIGGAGMAPEARIMPVRVCNDSGCPSAAIARGILWAADHGADVVNMSLAGVGFSDVTAAAIRYALDKNISVVASTGNDGLNGNPEMYPAANSGVIAVSATSPDGVPADWAVHGWQADIATVGESVLLTMPGAAYANGAGTSFSGPAVAGAVALLRASHPGITVDAVQAALQASANSSNWNRAWGAGRLASAVALDAADRGRRRSHGGAGRAECRRQLGRRPGRDELHGPRRRRPARGGRAAPRRRSPASSTATRSPSTSSRTTGRAAGPCSRPSAPPHPARPCCTARRSAAPAPPPP